MTPTAWIIVGIAGIVLLAISVGAWIYAARARRATGAGRHVENEIAALRSELDSMKDRNRLLEDRFERYDRSHTETRDTLDRMREDVEARLTRVSSHDTMQRELQDQIHEIRKEHQVLMERDERHERRVLELQEQVSELKREFAARPRRDGERTRV